MNKAAIPVRQAPANSGALRGAAGWEPVDGAPFALRATGAGFFEDEAIFQSLKTTVFPEFLRNGSRDAPIRIWVPGCAGGEDVYSIAILLFDFLEEQAAENPVQIFGSDENAVAISTARAGFYRESMLAKVPPDLLGRYFTRENNGYRISPRIREACVFARQNLIRDPPLSRIDLISCRDAQISPEEDLRHDVIPVLYYALKPKGYLVLRNEESIGISHLFGPIDGSRKIYMKQPAPVQPDAKKPDAARKEAWTRYDLQKEADRIVLAKYGPAGVIVNEEMEIVQLRGDWSPYLRPLSPATGSNLLKRAPVELVGELRAAIDLAKRRAIPIRREGLRVGSQKLRLLGLNLQVLPVNAPRDQGQFFLVLFEAVPRLRAGKKKPLDQSTGTTRQLGRELAETKRHMELLIDERQASEEKLLSANEEILSSNEELRSANEALVSSREELQTINEELITVNDELQRRNAELARLSKDLSSLLTGVNIAIVMLGDDLRIRHFTPTAARLLNLKDADTGRLIRDIQSNLEVANLEELLRGVVADLLPVDMDVQDRSGAWYSMRIRPYRNENNNIDGVVMVLYDVDQLKCSLEEVRQARDFSQAVVETIPGPLVILDSELQVMIGNRAFYDTFHLARHETEDAIFFEPIGARWDIPALREGLARAFSEKRLFEMEVAFEPIGAGPRIFSLAGRCIDLGEDKRRILLLSMADVTEQKLAERKVRSLERNLEHTKSSLRESEADLRRNREELRRLAARLLTTQEEERRRVSRELHDDLNQKLAMLEVDADRLGQRVPATPEIARELASLRDRFSEVSNDIRRVAYQLHPSILDHLGLTVALRSHCSEFSRREGIRVKFSVRSQIESVPEEIALCFYRVTQEGLRNIAKHASAKTASVTLQVEADRLHLAIRDNGVGFNTRGAQGGIGLLSMKERVRLVDGEFVLKSEPGQGTGIDIWAPMSKEAK